MAHALCVAGWRTAGAAGCGGEVCGWQRAGDEIDRANKRASVHKLQLARQRLPALALWIRWRGVTMAPPAGIQLLDLSRRRPAGCFGKTDHVSTAHALLHALPDARLAEVFDTLAAAGPVRIERIVSHGQASPEGFGMTRRRRSG